MLKGMAYTETKATRSLTPQGFSWWDLADHLPSGRRDPIASLGFRRCVLPAPTPRPGTPPLPPADTAAGLSRLQAPNPIPVSPPRPQLSAGPPRAPSPPPSPRVCSSPRAPGHGARLRCAAPAG